MTEIWISHRKSPDKFFGEVDSARAKRVARQLNAQGFKVRLKAVV